MHIVLLYQHYLGKGESGHSRLNEYARLWTAAGHSVSVITSQASYMTGLKKLEYGHRLCIEERDDAVTVYRVFVPNDANRSFSRRTMSYLTFAASSAIVFRRLLHPSVLLVSSPPLTIGLGALLITLFKRVPMVFEVRDLWPESAVTTGVLKNRLMIRMLYRLESTCYRRAKLISVLTPAFGANIASRYCIESERIRHVPCGVDPDDMNPARCSEAIRMKLGWTDRKVVLYTGAIGKANRLQQLVEVGKILRARSDVLISIIGAGMQREMIEHLITKNGLTNIVVQGPFSKEEMGPITASADICTAVLMKNDTFKTVYPNKVFDYMACGKPVVIGIDGIIRQLVESVGCGIFAEPENAADLAAAFEKLLDDRELAIKLGNKGREFVEKSFSRRQMALSYLTLLQQASEPCQDRVHVS